MENISSVPLSESTTHLIIDKDGDKFDDTQDYPNIIGMIRYLVQNSRLDIAYAVHLCTRFTHAYRKSRKMGVKMILRYL